VHFLERPFTFKPTFPDWREFLTRLGEWTDRERYELIVFDTLPSLWPVTKENDASEVQTALMPIRALTDRGVAAFLFHHARKADGGEGTSTRGSGAICGFVDTIIELRRFNAEIRGDRRRVLTGYGRFTQTAGELVIGLSEDGMTYTAHGDRAHASQCERIEAIRAVLPPEPPGLTAEEVYEGLDDPKPGKRTVAVDLGEGLRRQLWLSNGKGRRADPKRYWRE
jgi:hypothetical protein